MEENLVLELTDARSPTTKSSGRHLVISESWDRDMTVYGRIDFSRLRSMTVFGMWKSFFISGRMRLLQVLDLEDALGLTDADVKEMVELLPCLKFLSLRGCHGIFHLPSSIGNLRQLQTLDVIDTSIVTVPRTITKLQKLQYIRGGTTTISSEDPAAPNASLSGLSKFRRPRRRHLVGVGVPRGIRRLRALHTLGVVNISASSGMAILEELRMHTQLRKLGVCGVNENNSLAFFSAISCYDHLGSLSVWFDKENGCCLDVCSHQLMPFKNLQSLKLYGLVVGLHFLGIDQLSKLAKLNLEMTTLMEEDIRFLGMLPKLCVLRLCVNQPEDGLLCFRVVTDGAEECCYQKLKVLEIACMSSLHVTFGSKTMRNLDLLKVDCCIGSSYQLSGMVHLSQLKEVWLKGSYDEALKQDVQDQLADHPGKPVLKLEEEAPRQ